MNRLTILLITVGVIVASFVTDATARQLRGTDHQQDESSQRQLLFGFSLLEIATGLIPAVAGVVGNFVRGILENFFLPGAPDDFVPPV